MCKITQQFFFTVIFIESLPYKRVREKEGRRMGSKKGHVEELEKAKRLEFVRSWGISRDEED